MNRILIERGAHIFNPEEDLYKGALKLFKEKSFDSILQEEDFINIYLEYRDITDINILKNKLEEAIRKHQEATKNLSPFLQSITLPRTSDESNHFVDDIFFSMIINQVEASASIEIITYLIKANANRKDIVLDDNFWPTQEKSPKLEIV
ncbi:MAG: hypothetical protein GW941_00640 [Candidatus Pacebacteria bacterium]|nr:hypothetical protein [Candidatus Paceibacterota bacterium]